MSISADIASTKDVAEALSYWATAIGIIVTVVVGLAAVLKYFADQRSEHWRRADALYGEVLDSALAYPQFYGGNWAKRICKDPILENQYSYFVGKFLWAFEQIIRGKDYDSEWEDEIRIILREHVDFLSSPRFGMERAGYEQGILGLIDQVVAEKASNMVEASNA